MDKRKRQLIFVGFLLAFAISAPILMLHTSGYRFDWSQKRLFKTSLISVNTKPKGATVILNGVIQSKKTPLFISNLLPGIYTLQVTKAGFLSWQDNITVQTKQASVIKTINLIIDQPPQVLITGEVTQLKTSTKKNVVFTLSRTDTGLNLDRITLPDKSAHSLGTFSSAATLLTEPFEERILVSDPADSRAKYFLIDAKASTSKIPLSFIKTDLDQWQWVSSNELMGLSADGLCNILLSQQTIVCQPFVGQSFWYANDSIYYLNNQDQTTYLYVADRREIDRAKLLARLPRSDQYRLVADNQKKPVLIDSATQDLYMMNLKESLTSLVRIPGAAKEASWNSDRSQLLYFNDNEAYLWTVDDDKRTLLTRVSQPIVSAAWCGSYPHIVMSNSGRLSLLDNQTNPAASIALADNVGHWLTVDPDGRWVAYLTNNQSRSSLWFRQLYE